MPHLARVAALSLALCSVSTTGCGNDRPCRPGDSHCDSQGRLFECEAYESMWDDPTRWKTTDCGGADRCRTDPVGKAFCILDPATAPPCTPGEGWTCNEHGEYTCEDGQVTAWHVCAQCNPDGMQCDNPYGPCQSGGACPGQLTCYPRPTGLQSWCDAPCSCANGVRCPACDTFGKPGMSPFYCHDGWCYQSP